MKIKLIVFIFYLIFTLSLSYGQNGYQNYTFGMDINDLKNDIQNLKEDTYYHFTLIYLMQYLYRSELTGTVPNPRFIMGDEFKILTTGGVRENDYTFLFYNNKLVGVITYFRGNILPDIINRYGNGSNCEVSWGQSNSEGIVWLNNNQRFIVWEQQTYHQMVSYLEANWVREICRRRIEAFRIEQQQQKQQMQSRID